MPQFDSSTFASQIFWLVITFGALYFALTRGALPKIAGVLEARQSKIDDDLERATQLEQDAKEILAAYDESLQKARDEAQDVARQAAEEMAAEAARQHDELAARLDADVKAAEGRIAEALKAALGNIRQVATEAARAAARRLIGTDVDEARAEQAVDAALRERG